MTKTRSKTIRIHNERHIPVLQLCDKTEYQLTRDIISDCTELIDKIENGTLIELPCKVGDTVYEINSCSNKVNEIKARHLWDILRWKDDNLFGRWLFTNKAEAEQKLRELKDKI